MVIINVLVPQSPKKKTPSSYQIKSAITLSASSLPEPTGLLALSFTEAVQVEYSKARLLWVQILISPLFRSVTLGKLLSLSVLHFLHL